MQYIHTELGTPVQSIAIQSNSCVINSTTTKLIMFCFRRCCWKSVHSIIYSLLRSSLKVVLNWTDYVYWDMFQMQSSRQRISLALNVNELWQCQKKKRKGNREGIIKVDFMAAQLDHSRPSVFPVVSCFPCVFPLPLSVCVSVGAASRLSTLKYPGLPVTPCQTTLWPLCHLPAPSLPKHFIVKMYVIRWKLRGRVSIVRVDSVYMK